MRILQNGPVTRTANMENRGEMVNRVLTSSHFLKIIYHPGGAAGELRIGQEKEPSRRTAQFTGRRQKDGMRILQNGPVTRTVEVQDSGRVVNKRLTLSLFLGKNLPTSLA